MFKFTPEMFDLGNFIAPRLNVFSKKDLKDIKKNIDERAAYIANLQLKEWLDASSTAYFPGMEGDEWIVGDINEDYPFTKKAKLVCIEEIKDLESLVVI